MKRYTPDLNCLTTEFKRLAPCGDAAMMEHVTGSWVTHEDHLAAMEEQKTALQCIINTEANKSEQLREQVRTIANHIASAKDGLPDEWVNWVDEIEADLRRALDN